MSQEFDQEPFFLVYLKWHYGKGSKEFLVVVKNFFWFITHFFSFGLLTKTLFMPWKRLGESYGGGFNLGAFASTLIVNLLMRLVGFVTKTFVILIGLVTYFFVLIISLAAFIIWFLAPAVLLGSLILAITFFAI